MSCLKLSQLYGQGDLSKCFRANGAELQHDKTQTSFSSVFVKFLLKITRPECFHAAQNSVFGITGVWNHFLLTLMEDCGFIGCRS